MRNSRENVLMEYRHILVTKNKQTGFTSRQITKNYRLIERVIDYGVSQGSVLKKLLFLIYINAFHKLLITKN